MDQLVANLVETDIPRDKGLEVDLPGLGLQGLERLSAQGVLSLEIFLSVRIEPWRTIAGSSWLLRLMTMRRSSISEAAATEVASSGTRLTFR